jgi:hypothetical protein
MFGFNESSFNRWEGALILLVQEVIIFIIYFTILTVKWSKATKEKLQHAFSFKITSFLLIVLFCWFVQYPFQKILTLNSSEKSFEEQVREDSDKLEIFLKENPMRDSITSKQIDKLIDTLGIGWEKFDTTKKHN